MKILDPISRTAASRTNFRSGTKRRLPLRAAPRPTGSAPRAGPGLLPRSGQGRRGSAAAVPPGFANTPLRSRATVLHLTQGQIQVSSPCQPMAGAFMPPCSGQSVAGTTPRKGRTAGSSSPAGRDVRDGLLQQPGLGAPGAEEPVHPAGDRVDAVALVGEHLRLPADVRAVFGQAPAHGPGLVGLGIAPLRGRAAEAVGPCLGEGAGPGGVGARRHQDITQPRNGSQKTGPAILSVCSRWRSAAGSGARPTSPSAS